MRHSAAARRVGRRLALPVSVQDQLWGGRLGLVCILFVLVVIAAWSYWPTLASLRREWQRNDDYSAGQLVPLLALFLVWYDRKSLLACPLAPSWWAGLAVLLLAQAGGLYGLLFMFESAQRYALVLLVAGLVLLVAGRALLRRVFWIVLLLFLMIPLPGRIHNLISGPLQSLATGGAVFLLDAFGARVNQQGNVVMLAESTPLAVAEACSGLRMLTAFIIVAAFIAYTVKRPRWQKTTLLVSSIPVAVVCNIVRIFATALLMLLVSTELAEKFFHDFAGYVMMPTAVLLLFGELWLMDKLVIREEQV